MVEEAEEEGSEEGVVGGPTMPRAADGPMGLLLLPPWDADCEDGGCSADRLAAALPPSIGSRGEPPDVGKRAGELQQDNSSSRATSTGGRQWSA